MNTVGSDGYICCGSKKYNNRDFNRLVDSFDKIVRHNLLMPNAGYGTKNSYQQIVNIHVNCVINYLINPKGHKKPDYLDSYEEEYGMKEKTLENFTNYLKSQHIRYITYKDNNTHILHKLITKHNIDGLYHQIKLLKNGLASVMQLITLGIKPFLIGYSLIKEDLVKHVYNSKAAEKIGNCHRDDLECSLIIEMHKLGLIDATFCALEDQEDIQINDIIEPTQESLNLIRKYL